MTFRCKTGVHLDVPLGKNGTTPPPPWKPQTRDSLPYLFLVFPGKDLIFVAEATSNSSDERDLIRNFALDEKCRSGQESPSQATGRHHRRKKGRRKGEDLPYITERKMQNITDDDPKPNSAEWA
ncbi:hypothetical protein NPIL_530291 [Nephila pilipes]|uniref:Uncharacterized protein n=1 Tax=Nephila pilipes TaxID=299642 RepID=A0A8X6MQY7_NEPPI|nr:hypothetical protein NPIL_530291 [Nephila pilipes]